MLIFALNTYKDEAQAALCSGELKQFYPDAQVLVISDLPPNRLKTCDKGGQWTERYMREFLATPGDILLKIDPDTEVRKTTTTFPLGAMFANVIGGKLAGGIMGFKRAGVEAILGSQLLRDVKYTDPEKYGYDRFRGQHLRADEAYDPQEQRVSLQDAIMVDVASRLGIFITPWPEVCAHAQWWAPAPSGDWAFVHPRKRKQ